MNAEKARTLLKEKKLETREERQQRMNAEQARALLKETREQKQQSKLSAENNILADILTWLENNYEQYIIEAIDKNCNEQKCQVSFNIPVHIIGFSNDFVKNRVKNSIMTFFDNLGFSSIIVSQWLYKGSDMKYNFHLIQVIINLD